MSNERDIDYQPESTPIDSVSEEAIAQRKRSEPRLKLQSRTSESEAKKCSKVALV